MTELNSNVDLFRCSACRKRVRHNQTVICTMCKQSLHLSCTIFSSDSICTLCTVQLFPFSSVDSDRDFLSAISSRQFDSSTKIDHEALNNLKSQFKCDFTTSFLTPEEGLDADTNYY